MKAILEFNLPEDRDQFEECQKANKYWLALYEIGQRLRSMEKYGHPYQTMETLLEAIRLHFNEKTEGLLE